MNNGKVLPWQQFQWRWCLQRLHDGTLPHAMLLCGPAGVGKRRFANRLAGLLLCEMSNGSDQPCGRCKPCRSFAAGNQPDYRRIGPEQDSRQIRVGAIRELNHFIALSRAYEGYKLAVIEPAEAMNRNAANALLKTLEEPPPHTILLLISVRPERLPATVRSRCQFLRFPVPERVQSLSWLREELPGVDPEPLLILSHGAPVEARELMTDEVAENRRQWFEGLLQTVHGKVSAVALAERWWKSDLQRLFAWSSSWTVDAIRLRFEAESTALRNPDLAEDLRRLAQNANLTQLFALHDNLQYRMRILDTGVNHQLLVEDVLLAWKDTFNLPFRSI